MTENSDPTDLLGDPLTALPDKRGRRKIAFPEQVLEKVQNYAAHGLTQEQIADALGVSVKTLTKKCRKELDFAVSRQQAEALDMLKAAAAKGNVSAIKALLDRLDKHSASAAVKARERPAARAPAKGKKEERQDAATAVAQAGGKYATPPAPRLIN